MSCLPAHAVLHEQDLSHTLHVLRLELRNKYLLQEENKAQLHARNEAQHQNLVSIMKRCETTSLILYSQGQDFTFDVAYACQQATDLYHQFGSHQMPYEDIRTNLTVEIGRYDRLILSLQSLPPAIDTARTAELADLEQAIRHIHGAAPGDTLIPEAMVPDFPDGIVEVLPHEVTDADDHHPFLLDSLGRQDRDSCVFYAHALRENLHDFLIRLQVDEEHYNNVSLQVRKLNDYARAKYHELQQDIFINPGSTYFTLLQNFDRQWQRMKRDFHTKYSTLRDDTGQDGHVRYYQSQWRGPIILFVTIFMLFYIMLATVVSNVVLRLLVPRRWRTDDFRKKRPAYIILLGVIIFAVAVMVARAYSTLNLVLMATSLMVEMAWMIAVIYISMVVRLDADQCKEGSRVYTPFILMSLLVICFRIALIPNSVVNLIFPPILLLFTLWQAFTLRRRRTHLPLGDQVNCVISLVVMSVATVMAWVGYTLMAVQLLVWWMFQLAAIATIICIYDLLEMYEHRVIEPRIRRRLGYSLSWQEISRMARRGDFISSTWMYDFIQRALIPVLAVFSILVSILWAADIFNLRDLCLQWFTRRFAISGLLTLSGFRVCLAVSLYFVFSYFNYLVRAIWFAYRRDLQGEQAYNGTLARNIIGLLVWFLYVVIIFLMFHVPSTGIEIVTGGLATGMGFASKSLIENFFYGISLMSGRVRVGDYIECDGITGKVESISYQSTQLLTLDGSIVAILNSDLFSKNFKNLTRNHQYELTKIAFGVAYGSNVDEVRQVVLEGCQPLCKTLPDGRHVVDPQKPLSVTFSDFGASSVDLYLVAWVLVDQRIGFIASAKERIYDTLNAHHIEIPFPQQDVYIRQAP